MGTAILKLLFVIVMPIVVFAFADVLMMRATGRDQFPQSNATESAPLNVRLYGYNSAAASAYWQWLGTDGRLAEQRFLKADMIFPLVYGGALAISLLMAWTTLGRRLNQMLIIAPAVLAVIADWIENLVHMRQLRKFMQSEPVQANWIQLSSVATSTKWIFIISSVFLVFVFGIWMFIHELKAPKLLASEKSRE